MLIVIPPSLGDVIMSPIATLESGSDLLLSYGSRSYGFSKKYTSQQQSFRKILLFWSLYKFENIFCTLFLMECYKLITPSIIFAYRHCYSKLAVHFAFNKKKFLEHNNKTILEKAFPRIILRYNSTKPSQQNNFTQSQSEIEVVPMCHQDPIHSRTYQH